jgi:signal transduction histidine kinase
VVTVLVLERFLQDYLGYHSLSTSISVSFIIGLLVVPFKNWIQNYVDNAFLKGTPYQISQENTLMRQELTSADKLRSIAILASSLAHEIKNPITTINTFADYLPSKQNDTAFLNKCRQTLLHETERIDQLLTQLLSFAKPSPPDFELVYPQEIIDEILLLLEHKCAKQNITIIRSYYSKETILTDPNQLKQAFLNILLNAMESMPQKGILTVATSNNDTTFYISIKDSGIGIKPEELKKIFYPFFTNKQNGTGLGLAISQEIIHHHNGKISVKSTPNVGTEFIISIPKHITNHVNDNTL